MLSKSELLQAKRRLNVREARRRELERRERAQLMAQQRAREQFMGPPVELRADPVRERSLGVRVARVWRREAEDRFGASRYWPLAHARLAHPRRVDGLRVVEWVRPERTAAELVGECAVSVEVDAVLFAGGLAEEIEGGEDVECHGVC